MTDIPVNLAVEDELSEAVLRRILADSGRPYVVCTCYRRGGFGFLRSNIAKFNQASRVMPYIVLTDLDLAQCPPTLIRDWLNQPRNPGLLLRVAVREVEAWLLADPLGLAAFLGVAPPVVPRDVESLPDAKQSLINVARRSRRRELRQSIVPPPGSTRTQGPNYNGALLPFVQQQWNIAEARRNADSLERAVRAARSLLA